MLAPLWQPIWLWFGAQDGPNIETMGGQTLEVFKLQFVILTSFHSDLEGSAARFCGRSWARCLNFQWFFQRCLEDVSKLLDYFEHVFGFSCWGGPTPSQTPPPHSRHGFLKLFASRSFAKQVPASFFKRTGFANGCEPGQLGKRSRELAENVPMPTKNYRPHNAYWTNFLFKPQLSEGRNVGRRCVSRSFFVLFFFPHSTGSRFVFFIWWWCRLSASSWWDCGGKHGGGALPLRVH